MSDRTRNGVVALAGIGLVLLGAWMILENVLAPVFHPLGQLLNGLSHLGWPLLLICAGVLLLSRRHPHGTGALQRSRSNRVIGGVLGGVGARFGIDATIVRVAFILLALAVGIWPAVALYVVALIALPEEPAAWTVPIEAPAPPAPPVS